jgi:hypothetical protein
MREEGGEAERRGAYEGEVGGRREEGGGKREERK